MLLRAPASRTWRFASPLLALSLLSWSACQETQRGAPAPGLRPDGAAGAKDAAAAGPAKDAAGGASGSSRDAAPPAADGAASVPSPADGGSTPQPPPGEGPPPGVPDAPPPLPPSNGTLDAGRFLIELDGAHPLPAQPHTAASFDPKRRQLAQIEVLCRAGKCDGRSNLFVAGWAGSLHFGTATWTAGAPQVALDVSYTLYPDRLWPRGMSEKNITAAYKISFAKKGDYYEGQYTGTFDGQPVSGAARASLRTPFGVPIAGVAAAAPGEHPRVYARKADLAKVRARGQHADVQAGTAWHRGICQASDQILWSNGTFDDSYVRYQGQLVREHGGGTVAWACALASLTSSDPFFCKQAEKVAIGTTTRNTYLGQRQVDVAATYDVCYDAWTPAGRAEAQRFIKRKDDERFDLGDDEKQFLLLGQLVGLLTIRGDDNDANVDAEIERREMLARRWIELSLGARGWPRETWNWDEAVPYISSWVLARRNGSGLDLGQGTALGEMVRTYLASGGYLGVNSDVYNYGVPTGLYMMATPSQREAFKAIESKVAWPTGTSSLDVPTVGLFGGHFEIAAREPTAQDVPHHFEDERMGAYAFRKGPHMDDFALVVSTARGDWNTTMTAGDFALWGGRGGQPTGWTMQRAVGIGWLALPSNALAHPSNVAWVEGAVPVGPARVEHLEQRPDGSGAISLVVDQYVKGEQYTDETTRDRRLVPIVSQATNQGIVWRRALAIDYSGEAGAPVLFAWADRVTGGGAAPRFTQLNVDHHMMYPNRVAARADGFTLTPTVRSGSPPAPNALTATVVTPKGADLKPQMYTKKGDTNQIRIAGGETFVVVTIGPGTPPAVQVTGEGLAATVKVGKRQVRLVDTRMVIEPAP